jgi:peptidoglycan/xylan/chitin deacetylase (PgdA/CDA1 family)
VLVEPPAADDAPSVVLTFDDGWRDNLTAAWPVLRRHGVRPTIFLVRDWVAAGRSAAGDFLRPDEVAELAARGVEFGAHTATHPRLTAVGPARAEEEMRDSKHAVEEWTGSPCRFFAYPYGAHDPTVARLAADLFEAAVVVGGGWWTGAGDRVRLPRIGIHEDMTSSRALFAARLAGAA